jgi:hypothetical protein
MARAYTVATVALALGVDSKWVDNVLSRFSLVGVMQSRQGVSRKISTEGALQLATILTLSEVLRVPVEAAIERSRQLAESGELFVGAGLYLRLDRREQLRDLQLRLEYAVEATPIPRRGRPAGKTKRGAD